MTQFDEIKQYSQLYEENKKLLTENKELKKLLKEGKQLFSNVSDLLNLKKIADNGMMFAKIPGIIRKIQDNPKLMEEILQFINKLNQYEATGNSQ
ncbi:MAG: hypothetical protein HPY79_11665 [Bacteroidales bacterium]|jgi:cell division septum initiation protein DivIVA|nr:hypothetical protein [Bacteroidales bacterium]